jgi:hypothetical protein
MSVKGPGGKKNELNNIVAETQKDEEDLKTGQKNWRTY